MHTRQRSKRGAEQILHEYAGAQVRPARPTFEVILASACSDDADADWDHRPERGEFHNVLHAGALRSVNERALLLDLIGVVPAATARDRRLESPSRLLVH